MAPTDPSQVMSTNLNIKPPEFICSKEEYPAYKRRLERWSRTCGVEKKLQADLVLMYAGKNKIAEMLDREIGDDIVENADGIKTILGRLVRH